MSAPAYRFSNPSSSKIRSRKSSLPPIPKSIPVAAALADIDAAIEEHDVIPFMADAVRATSNSEFAAIRPLVARALERVVDADANRRASIIAKLSYTDENGIVEVVKPDDILTSVAHEVVEGLTIAFDNLKANPSDARMANIVAELAGALQEANLVIEAATKADPGNVELAIFGSTLSYRNAKLGSEIDRFRDRVGGARGVLIKGILPTWGNLVDEAIERSSQGLHDLPRFDAEEARELSRSLKTDRPSRLAGFGVTSHANAGAKQDIAFEREKAADILNAYARLDEFPGFCGYLTQTLSAVEGANPDATTSFSRSLAFRPYLTKIASHLGGPVPRDERKLIFHESPEKDGVLVGRFADENYTDPVCLIYPADTGRGRWEPLLAVLEQDAIASGPPTIEEARSQAIGGSYYKDMRTLITDLASGKHADALAGLNPSSFDFDFEPETNSFEFSM